MTYRPRWALLGFGAVIVVLLFTYPTWRKFLTGRASAGAYAGASDAQKEVFADISKKSGRDAASTAYIAMLTVVPAPTNEQPTPALPDAQAVLTGEFIALDAVHTASGHVTLYRSANGNLLLRFDDFSVTNGPDLHVYLSGNAAPKTKADLGVSGVLEIDIGPLKGSIGNQQYPVPAELKIANYKSVVIYSESLAAVYSTARLQ
jgi:Electron transfer DM13